MGTITETYQRHAHQFPDKIAIQTLKERLTYQTWFQLVSRTANWLDSLDVSRKTLAIYMPNGIPFLQLFAGAAMAGWVVVPFDLKWTESEIHKRLALSKPSLFVAMNEFFLEAELPKPMIKGWNECNREIMQSPAEWNGQVEDSLPFYMGFTSGTTGEPKGFIRSHTSWAESFECNRLDFHIQEEDTVLIPGALIHSHFLYGAISTLYLGATVFLLEKFSPAQTMLLLETQPVTVVYLVPTMTAAMIAENHRIEKPVKILSSGAKWEADSKQKIRELFPYLSMYEFYGASELSFVTVLTNQDSSRKPGSVGKPCHNVDIQIRLADSTLAKPNEHGKIFVKSRMTFIGYIKDESIEFIHDSDGWITVNDMGYLDEEGFLFIKGREKNMILYGGINIFPEEIEKVISTHPEVDEVAVIGLYDPYWGQIVTAVIKGSAVPLELKRLCRKQLSSFKVPRKWFYVEEMPYTSSRKIARSKLKELILRR